jgi:putative zinc finger/helix-turn-helix YgiT family protein
VKPTVVDYAAEMEHDGRSYSFVVPQLEVLECENCRARTLPDAAFERVTAALRAKAELLTPAEIRQKREALKLTQKQLAAFLKVAESTVSRWETGGQIQQRAMDLLLRGFFEVPEVRRYYGLLAGSTTSGAPAGGMASAPSSASTAS